jgi:hypothetical protein
MRGAWQRSQRPLRGRKRALGPGQAFHHRLDQDTPPVMVIGPPHEAFSSSRSIRLVTDAGANPEWRAISPALSGPWRCKMPSTL